MTPQPVGISDRFGRRKLSLFKEKFVFVDLGFDFSSE